MKQFAPKLFANMRSTKDNTASLSALLASVSSKEPVVGYTHAFYRYPARFSPQFARAAIETFTTKDDTVLDPFMGGGTSAVEALVAGRRFVGCDINPLSLFVTKVKTSVLSETDIQNITDWAGFLQAEVNLRKQTERQHNWSAYQRNAPWWIRKTLELALNSVCVLDVPQQQDFARCVLLNSAQWALDCRKTIPTTREFLFRFRRDLEVMIEGARSFRQGAAANFECPASKIKTQRKLLLRSAANICNASRVPDQWLPPKLILTSPPYVGVHILYHRWQVRGRRETPAPFWLAGCQDGYGAAHYTFGSRERKMNVYLEHFRACFESIVSLMGNETVLVQLVAFSKPDSQLQPYLQALESLGLVQSQHISPLWRSVPNRKWYARVRGITSSSQEVLLIHTKRCGSV